MATNFRGSWSCSKRENYDDFLKAMNIGLAKRTIAKKIPLTLDIEVDGNDKFHVKSKSGPTTRNTTFEIGQVIEDKSPAGENMRGKWEWDGDAMVCELDYTDSGKHLTIRRTIEDGKLVERMILGGVECTRWFDKKA